MPTRIGGLFALAAIAGLAMAAVADAAPSRKKAIWGPVRVDGVSQFPIYRELGAGIYQMELHWNQVASGRPARPTDPTDPAYRWPASVDDAVQEAGRYGIQLSILISGTPRWASGRRNPDWAPRRPADFGRFARAASRRYPSVRLWMIWGEPTRRKNFQPLVHERRDRPLTRQMKRGPHRYARILDSAYVQLKRQSGSNLVIGGNSFTTGDVSPLNWI